MNKEIKDFMLTTSDNPYNPYTNFDDWYSFDEQKGYCTCGFIARFTKTSDDLSDDLQELDKIYAMDRIMELFPVVSGTNDVTYVKVFDDSNDSNDSNANSNLND